MSVDQIGVSREESALYCQLPRSGLPARVAKSELCTSAALLVPNVSRQGIASPFPVAPFSAPSFRLKPTTHPEQTIRQGYRLLTDSNAGAPGE